MKKAEKTLAKKTLFLDELKTRVPAADADRIWSDAERRLAEMYEQYADLPKGVAMHTDNFIFPSAAVYLAIKAENEDLAWSVMEKCMREKSTKMGDSLNRMSRIPGFNRFFLWVWDPVSHKMFGPNSGFRNRFYKRARFEYRMDVLACPYNRYLTEVGCPELTILFCKNDEYSYGHMEGLHFIRTGTLGSGADRCDFRLLMDKKHR